MKLKYQVFFLILWIFIMGCAASKELKDMKNLKTETLNCQEIDVITHKKPLLINEKAPLFKATNISDSTEVSLSNIIEKKIIIIHFWDPKSPSSLKEIRFLEKLYSEYHQQNLEIIGIESSGLSVEEIHNILTILMNWKQIEGKISYTLLSDEGLRIIKCYGVNGVNNIPWTFIIDLNGTIKYIKKGFEEADEKKIINTLEELFKADKEASDEEVKPLTKEMSISKIVVPPTIKTETLKENEKPSIKELSASQTPLSETALAVPIEKPEVSAEKAKIYIDKIGEGVYKR